MGNKLYSLQASFAGGEVSPDMYGRTDLAKFSVSAKKMINFYPHFFGGASNRPGTKYICEVKDSSKKVKLLPFQFSVEQAYVIEAGENYFRYIRDGGQIINPPTSTIVETTTTYTESDLFNLKTAQSADVLYICNSKYKPKTLTRSSHYNWEFADFKYKNGPFRTQNTTDTTITASNTTGTGITLTASSNIFESSHIGSLFQISHDVTGQTLSLTYSATTTSGSIKCKGTWSLVTSGTFTGTVAVQWSTDNGSTWQTIRSYSASSTNIQDDGETDDLVLLRIVYTHTSGTAYINLNAYSFIMDGVVKINAVTSGTSATADVITDLAFTTATKDWAEGSWSTKNGYPSCVKFYQNRLSFAGTIKDPLTLWLSQVGDYPNFVINIPSKDDDAITAPLVSQGVNAIRSMVSLGNLLAFTAGGEWKIGTGSESTALTSSSVRAVQQGYRGSSTLEPVVIGDRVLYCQDMGSVVRDFGYSITDDAYKGDNLTLLARHLFNNHSIVDWCFQQEPDGIIWAVRDDGVLLSFTYIKEQDVWAWARHETYGKFESVCAIPGDTYTEVYFVVKREINGSTKRYIEKLAQRMESIDPRDQFFVDCGLSYNIPITITGATQASPIVITAPEHGLTSGNYIDISNVVGMTELNGNRYKVGSVTTNTFTLLNMDDSTSIDGTSYASYKSGGYVRKCVITLSGLEHLEGKEVSILADGSVNPPQTVINGSITLDDYASRVHVGLGYVCDLETLNTDYQMKDGTTLSRNKEINKVNVMLENSYGGKIGINNYDNLETIEPILSNIMGKPGDLYTGNKEVYPKSIPSANATVYIRQTDPLPMTVLAVIPEVVIGDN